MKPGQPPIDAAAHPGRWWHAHDERIICDLCPRNCSLKPGDRGFCFVRENQDGQMVLSTYGRSTGFCVDPIEKKPLNHFLPGTPVLSFGTAGCNLGCQFCQNWDISKSRQTQRLSKLAMPDQIASAAEQLNCHSVAFTYNDPVIWAEYAIDTAKACHQRGIQTVAVTAGYIHSEPRREFFSHIDAANVDLKSFSESFYQKITYSHLEPVLQTLSYLHQETDCWLEVCNLIIPDANDDPDQLKSMCDWILQHLGDQVPVHFSAFHPDYRMRDRENTPVETLVAAYDLARASGLKYVYVGNVHDEQRQSTFCHGCGNLVIQRDWYQLGQYHLTDNRCNHCHSVIPGRFLAQPGDWGRRRLPVEIDDYCRATTTGPQAQTPLKLSDSKATIVNTSSADQDSSAQGPSFDAHDQNVILRCASDLVTAAVTDAPLPNASECLGPLSERPVEGVFVTLHRGKQLRGCIGVLGQTYRLDEALAMSALRTAKEDTRMPPISPIELPYLSLDVTVLSAPQLVAARGDDRADAVEVGRHGLRIRMGQHQGLLLPSVATDQGWDATTFLNAVCRKAGLPLMAWRDDASVLETFEGTMMQSTMQSAATEPPEIVSSAQCSVLADLAADNVRALLSGAVPTYVATALPDGTVNGLVLSATSPTADTLHWIQLSPRPGMPLQSTLFALCQQATEAIRTSGNTRWRFDLAVMWDPALHGTSTDYDLQGVDPSKRSLVLTDGRHTAINFDQQTDPVDQFEMLIQSQTFAMAHVLTMQTASSSTTMRASHGPSATIIDRPRQPAVAGTFYPGEDQQRDALVDQLLNADPPEPKRSALAAMVPHAGLKYSGKIAAQVLRQIELADDIIIIGPKHTPHGVHWAVAPCTHWQLSATTQIAANRSLAEAIAQNVIGMQLDAAAHAQEHAIEVELPLLYRLKPEARVTGIVVHGGTVGQLKQAGAQLAAVMQQCDRLPLLLISSDMNHFADDDETRRRDALALEAMQSLDSNRLLQTCHDNDISMCGQRPAALVLETLHALGQPFSMTSLGYATSADVSGDKTRVVGYAGALLG